MTGSSILDTLNSKSLSGGNMNTTYARFRLQAVSYTHLTLPTIA